MYQKLSHATEDGSGHEQHSSGIDEAVGAEMPPPGAVFAYLWWGSRGVFAPSHLRGLPDVVRKGMGDEEHPERDEPVRH